MCRSTICGITVYFCCLALLPVSAGAQATRDGALREAHATMKSVMADQDFVPKGGRIPFRQRLLSRLSNHRFEGTSNPEPFSPTSAQSWVRNYPSSTIGSLSYRANKVVVDGSGNVYVTGYGGSDAAFDFITIKYTTAGDTSWVRTYSFLGGALSDDKAVSLAVDTSGNVYVTGLSLRSTSPVRYDMATVKYNASGVQQWASRYSGRGGDNEPSALAVDGSGNVYVTGFSADTTGVTARDYTTIKYNSSGDTVWTRRYHNGITGGNDGATAMVLGTTGNLYVTGSAQYSLLGFEYLTIAYNAANGDTTWVRHYRGPSTDDASALDIASFYDLGSDAEYVYVTGSSITVLDDYDVATVKYNSSGTQQWAIRYDGPSHNGGSDEGTGIAVDEGGRAFVGGWSRDSSTYDDYLTIRYSPGGVQQWTARYTSPGANSDRAIDIALDASSNVYVSGTANSHFATLKYDSSGVQQWLATYVGAGATLDPALSMALGSSGAVYVTGGSSAGTGSIFTTVKYVQATISVAPVVFLEGAYNTTTDAMNTTLRSSGALASRFPGVFIPSRAVDSITVEIRNDSTSALSTVQKFAPAWLLADGSIRMFVDTTKAFVEFDAPAGNYYVVVRNRNHLAVMSAAKVAIPASPSVGSYNFSTGLGQAFKNGQKQIDSSPVRYGIVAGNVDGNTGVGASDIVQVRSAVGAVGYTINDVDMNSGVGASDIVLTRGNVGQITQVPQ